MHDTMMRFEKKEGGQERKTNAKREKSIEMWLG